ncbi:hypothetical protein KAR28_01190 [Candidatus Parcubacteria bacterium]|nr:hypothetical protein [Candidatus Parcubacteria bacterium]
MQHKIQNQNSEQNENQEQPPKKEHFLFMTLKTPLIVLIFVVFVAIIIGGVCYCLTRGNIHSSQMRIEQIKSIELSQDKKAILNSQTKEVIFTIDDANKYLKNSGYAYNPDAFKDDKDTNVKYAGDCFTDMALSNNKNKIVFSVGCLPLAFLPRTWVGIYQIQNPYKCPADRFCEIIPASFNLLINASGRNFIWSVDDKIITYDRDSVLTSERGREITGTDTLTINSSTGEITNFITRDVCYNNKKTELEMNSIDQLHTYRDFIGGFEITFPSSWQNRCGSLREGGINDKIDIRYYSEKDVLVWENMEINNLDDIKKDIEKIDRFIIGGKLIDELYINNQLFLKYYFEHMGNEEGGFITIRDGVIYDISYPVDTQTSNSVDPNIDKAISTFKFIN